MVSLSHQSDFRSVQALPFCYLCGRQFVPGDNKNWNHVPPECIFAPLDRDPLWLPAHSICNKSYELLDEKPGRSHLRFGKVPISTVAVCGLTVSGAMTPHVGFEGLARGRDQAARRARVLVGPGPRQQFIEFLHWPAIDQLGEDIGQISLRVDSVNLCGLDQRSETRPVDRPLLVTRK
jgi:hypothetical protein